jgi:hypothetical protein
MRRLTRRLRAIAASPALRDARTLFVAMGGAWGFLAGMGFGLGFFAILMLAGGPPP